MVQRKEAIRELWYRGILTYKLHAAQKKMLEAYLTQNQEITVFACSRRFGKSFMFCLLAIEQCLKKKNSIVKYVCPRKDQVKKIIEPIMMDILADAPPELKPSYKHNEKVYKFPNGSQIQIAGTDNGHHETLRGGRSDLWIVDEAGFCDELKYVVNSVLAPTSDTTGGRGIIASTPAPTYDHDFNSEFLAPAEANNRLIRYTIYDNPMLSAEKIEEIIARFKLGKDDPEFRREYLCHVIADADRLVVPEFTPELMSKIVTDKYIKPPYYDAYESMDIGVRDLTVVLFAYWDFKNAKLVIEDEFITNGKEFRTDTLASNIKIKEKQLYTHQTSGEFKPPYLRIADNNNLVLLNDLSFTFNLTFLPTRKDDKLAALNSMRVMLAEEKILIHPRCKVLCAHLRNCTWDKGKENYARSADNGHYDAVDALVYLVRNLHMYRNPYPPGYHLPSGDKFKRVNSDKPDVNNPLIAMFTPKKSLRSGQR